jgi:hypothetical protein
MGVFAAPEQGHSDQPRQGFLHRDLRPLHRANRWPLCPRCPLEQLRSVFDNQPEIAPYSIMPLGLLVSVAAFMLLAGSGDEAASRGELTGTPQPSLLSCTHLVAKRRPTVQQ